MAEAITRFWLHETPPKKRFARDDALDAEIARRFGETRDAIVGSDAAGWTGDPQTLLAAVVALDQFSRNIHRGSGRAFEADPLARALSGRAIDRGWDERMTDEQRQFLYMPFMHSEDLADQDRSVALYTALGDSDPLDYARRHRTIIARFGRFPARNQALGRKSNAAELTSLANPENAF